MSKQTFAERCQISEQCLPDAPYRAVLTQLHKEMLAALAEQPAQQEPVAWLDGPHLVMRSDWRDRANYKGPWVDFGRAIPDSWAPVLYTTPQPPAQREWIGLTDEDKEFIAKRAAVYDWHDYEVIEASEAKLKEKNT